MPNEERSRYWQQQSPIRIARPESFFVPALAGALHVLYPDGEVVLERKKGHQELEWSEAAGTAPWIALDGKKASFRAMHVHRTSEHEIAGQKTELGEIHFVHELVSAERGSTLVVLSVRVESGNSDGPCFSAPAPDSIRVDLKRLIPPRPYRFYRYEGSLTSGTHDELVSWAVFAEPLAVTRGDVAIVQKYAEQTDREVQSLARRFVLRSFEE